MNMQQINKDVERLERECWTTIIQQYFNALSSKQVTTKANAHDFQTIADVQSEAFLTAELQKLIPNSIVLGEEAQAAGSVSLDIFKQAQHDQHVWVIDPIDGTFNFVNSTDNFALMVSLVKNNETLGAWIYKPRSDDFIYANKGQGAFMNGQKTHVSNREKLADLNGYSPLLYSDRTPHKAHFQAAAQDVASLDNLQCAGVHYMNMATGSADFYIANHSKPWDHLAGGLILEEAGGVITQWDGSPYKPTDNAVGLIAANNAKAHKALMDRFIQPVWP
jgi:fructose-1,6-bisphosphatase/inositol monophosphatase family enzyme